MLEQVPASPTAVIDAPTLGAFARQVLVSAGMRPTQADDVAEVLVWADLRGVESHGCARLPLYLGWLRSGEMNGQADIRTGLSLPALAIVEADRSAGAPAMRAGARLAATLAGRSGCGIVLVRDTTHTGALGFYVAELASRGFAAVAMAASGPNMVYHGAASAAVSTSPLAIAVPAAPGARPLVFDMSTSAVAFGKLQAAKALGRPLPAGWAADAEGRPTTDPQAATAPLPLGGPKGSGLALMVEALASLLAGNPILAPSLASPGMRHCQNGLILAIDVAQAGGLTAYGLDIAALSDSLHHLRPAGDATVLLPGERGSAEAASRSVNGIPLTSTLRQALRRAGDSVGLAPPWPAADEAQPTIRSKT